MLILVRQKLNSKSYLYGLRNLQGLDGCLRHCSGSAFLCYIVASKTGGGKLYRPFKNVKCGSTGC